MIKISYITPILILGFFLGGCGIFDLGKTQTNIQSQTTISTKDGVSISTTLDNVNPQNKKSLIDYKKIQYFTEQYNYAKLPHGNTVTVCSAHGCQHAQEFRFRKNHLEQLFENFKNVNSAEDERIAIKKTLADIEMIVGPVTNTSKDRKSTDFFGSGDPTQLDCVDEAANVTSYLIVLVNNGMIKYHNILSPTWKARLLTWTHYVARIQDNNTKENWVIDAGYQPASGEPKIVSEKEWLK